MASSYDAQSLGRNIKRLVIAGLVIGLTVWIGCSTTRRVDAGHVGVKVKLAGESRGVQDEPLTPGWHFFNPLTEQIIFFPTNVFNVVWTASVHEGRPVDESITFSSSEGANVNSDIGLSFHIDPQLAPKLYNRFRQNDMLVLANGYMRNTVREAFSESASKLKVTEIYGVEKSRLLKDANDKCKDVFAKDGIIIDQLTINGALRLPPLIEAGINRSLEQQQNAKSSENKVAQVEAEARQQITAAHGAAEAARQKAQGEADALLINARAQAQANEILRLSMTPAIMQYRAMEKWNGALPQFNGAGQTPLLTFDVSKGEVLPEAERQRRLKELLEAQARPVDPMPATPAPGSVAPVAPPQPAPAAPAPKR